MPQPEIEKLSKASSDDQAKAAISSCIAMEVRRGTPQDQAVAMCTDMVKNKMGREMMPPGGKK